MHSWEMDASHLCRIFSHFLSRHPVLHKRPGCLSQRLPWWRWDHGGVSCIWHSLWSTAPQFSLKICWLEILEHLQWSVCVFSFFQQLFCNIFGTKRDESIKARHRTIVTSLDQCWFSSSGLLPVWWCELRLSSSLILLRSTWPHRDARADASPHWLAAACSRVSRSQSELLVSASSPTGQPVVERVGEGENVSMNGNAEETLRHSSNIYPFHHTNNKDVLNFVWCIFYLLVHPLICCIHSHGCNEQESEMLLWSVTNLQITGSK